EWTGRPREARGPGFTRHAHHRRRSPGGGPGRLHYSRHAVGPLDVGGLRAPSGDRACLDRTGGKRSVRVQACPGLSGFAVMVTASSFRPDGTPTVHETLAVEL